MTEKMPPLDPGRITEIRERANAATPGPWVCSDRGDGSASLYVEGDEGGTALLDDGRCPFIRGEVRREDGVFAAHARSDIPYLLDLVTSLTQTLGTRQQERDKGRQIERRLRETFREPDDSLDDLIDQVAFEVRRSQEAMEAIKAAEAWPPNAFPSMHDRHVFAALLYRALKAERQRAALQAALKEIPTVNNDVLTLLTERAKWYRDGCDGLEDVESYFASGDCARDAASDLETALSEIRVLEGVIRRFREGVNGDGC